MTRLKRFKIGLFTITLGMVLVGASFALADDKAVAEGIILPEELNETTAILTPSVAIAENEPTTQPEEWIDAVATAYCPCEICCGKWALNRPDGIVYTASGAIERSPTMEMEKGPDVRSLHRRTGRIYGRRYGRPSLFGRTSSSWFFYRSIEVRCKKWPNYLLWTGSI